MSLQSLSTFLRRFGGELLAIAVLLPLVIVLGFVLVRFPDTSQGPSASPSVPAAAEEHIRTVPPKATVLVNKNTRADVLTVEIHNGETTDTLALAAPGDITVADALTRLVREEQLIMETKDFGAPLGVFIESLNGVKNDPPTDRYWHLYINGALSPVGASSARVHSGDTMTWRLETMQEGD